MDNILEQEFVFQESGKSPTFRISVPRHESQKKQKLLKQKEIKNKKSQQTH